MTGLAFRFFALLILSLPALPSRTLAADHQVIDITPGQTKDVYFEFNLKEGRLYLRIVSRPDGEACANFWWIKWPLGNIKDLGRHCGSAIFDVPGWFDLALSAKLRAGGAVSPIKIVVSESQAVANSVPLPSP